MSDTLTAAPTGAAPTALAASQAAGAALTPAGSPPITAYPPRTARQLSCVVQSWLVSAINNSPVSRHTDAYNHLVASLPALVAALTKEI